MTTSQYHISDEVSSKEDHWYRSLYEESPDLYCTLNEVGIILDCNKSYIANLGYSKDEIVGKSIFGQISKMSLDIVHRYFDEWKKTGKVVNKEIWLKKKDDTVFPVLLSSNSVYDKHDNLVGCNNVMKDISEIIYQREKIQERDAKIQDAMDELKKINVARDQFLAMVTHELKTPLVPIKGYAELLLAQKFGPISEEQKPKLEMIRSCTETMLKIISDLLDVQKLELGKLRFLKETLKISEVISSAIEKIQSSADRHHVIITANLQPDIFYLCDKTRIQQVISNLIYNSLDFVPKENGKIDVKLFTDKNDIRIIIKDNGIGMVKENLDKLFHKFYQADTSSTREHGGSGLGLSICKGIIENHGGKIWAASEGIGTGMEMHISLPSNGVNNPST